MSTFEHHTALKHEETDAPEDLGTPIKEFCCTLCGFGFSKEKYLKNHFELCKDVEYPADRLGADSTSIKSEPCEEEIQDTELFIAPTHDVKYEEMEFSETTISGSTSAQLEHPKTETLQDKPFESDICDYGGAKKGRLSILMKSQSKEKSFKCSECEYVCTHACRLRTHMRTHTKEKLFRCHICDYASAQNGTLKAHIRTHTGERPYKCQICEYACAQRANLIAHVRCHTGEKSYKCDKCSYSSSQPTNLTNHILTHSREKPFQCDECDFATVYRSYLKIHRRQHTKEKLIDVKSVTTRVQKMVLKRIYEHIQARNHISAKSVTMLLQKIILFCI